MPYSFPMRECALPKWMPLPRWMAKRDSPSFETKHLLPSQDMTRPQHRFQRWLDRNEMPTFTQTIQWEGRKCCSCKSLRMCLAYEKYNRIVLCVEGNWYYLVCTQNLFNRLTNMCNRYAWYPMVTKPTHSFSNTYPSTRIKSNQLRKVTKCICTFLISSSLLWWNLLIKEHAKNPSCIYIDPCETIK